MPNQKLVYIEKEKRTMPAKSSGTGNPRRIGIVRRCATAAELLFGSSPERPKLSKEERNTEAQRVAANRRSQVGAFSGRVEWAQRLEVDPEMVRAYAS